MRAERRCSENSEGSCTLNRAPYVRGAHYGIPCGYMRCPSGHWVCYTPQQSAELIELLKLTITLTTYRFSQKATSKPHLQATTAVHTMRQHGWIRKHSTQVHCTAVRATLPSAVPRQSQPGGPQETTANNGIAPFYCAVKRVLV